MNNKRSSTNDNEVSNNKRIKQTGFTMGRRKFFLPTQNKRQTVVPDDVKMNNFDEIKKESFECPNCAKIIYPPYPPNLGQLIKSLKDQETQHDKEKQEEYKSYVAQCKEKGEIPLPFLTEPLEIDINQKKNICRVHKIELKYKPMAKEKGYPEHIDFNLIDKRIMSFQEELKSIIDKSLPSSFLDNALKRFEKLGTKARNTDEVLKTFEAYLPGYYGNKGSDKIMDTLNRLFLQTDYMNNEKAAPLTVVEFLQQVLVPECGIRLIREDKQNKITLEEAKSIMSESQEYGSTVYFSVDVDNKKE